MINFKWHQLAGFNFSAIDEGVQPAFDKRPVMKSEKEWALAQKRHRLSTATVMMAKRLGMNPKKLGKLDNHKQEPWKAPLPEFIKHLYEKRFGKPSSK